MTDAIKKLIQWQGNSSDCFWSISSDEPGMIKLTLHLNGWERSKLITSVMIESAKFDLLSYEIDASAVELSEVKG